MKDRCLAIIPARMSSKRLPGKNFIDWFGRPIIEWVVEEIENSKLFDNIFVSYDGFPVMSDLKRSAKYMNVRDPEFFTYESRVDDICRLVLQSEKDRGMEYDYISCVYPTAYAVKAHDIKLGFLNMTRYTEKGKKHIPFCHSYGMLNGKPYNLPYISDNGGFYWAKVDEFLKQKTLMGRPCVRHEAPMVDINTYEDYIDAMAHRLSMSDYLKKECHCDT